jgi:phosphoglycerate dehydrogenase-like enzyme
LLDVPNLVLTPHVAGMTPEVVEAGLDLSVKNIQEFLAGRDWGQGPRAQVGYPSP